MKRKLVVLLSFLWAFRFGFQERFICGIKQMVRLCSFVGWASLFEKSGRSHVGKDSCFPVKTMETLKINAPKSTPKQGGEPQTKLQSHDRGMFAVPDTRAHGTQLHVVLGRYWLTSLAAGGYLRDVRYAFIPLHRTQQKPSTKIDWFRFLLRCGTNDLWRSQP